MEVMVLQCGQIRYRIRRSDDGLRRDLHVHTTDLALDGPTEGLSRGEALAAAYAALVDDRDRTARVCADVAEATRAGRNCLVLTGCRTHVATLTEGLRDRGLDPLVLHGGLTPRTLSNQCW